MNVDRYRAYHFGSICSGGVSFLTSSPPFPFVSSSSISFCARFGWLEDIENGADEVNVTPRHYRERALTLEMDETMDPWAARELKENAA